MSLMRMRKLHEIGMARFWYGGIRMDAVYEFDDDGVAGKRLMMINKL